MPLDNNQDDPPRTGDATFLVEVPPVLPASEAGEGRGTSVGSGDPALLVGQELQRTYLIEKVLGAGGMGTVYEASHLRVRRRFAIKVLLPAVASDHEAMARFQREALVTSELGHPHIIEVIDFNHLRCGTPYIVMELLEGEDLEQRLDFIEHLEVRMPLHDVAAILHQTASALHAAHKRGIIHRDMKPSNIFLCNRVGQPAYVKVLDFGISKVLGTKNELTCAERIMGTPHYMAPEQAEGRASQVDPRTDIFSMGAILYTMMTGRPPFTGDSIPEVLYKVAREDAASPCEVCPSIPGDVSGVVMRALSKDPVGRPSSMNDLWREFADAVGREASKDGQPQPCHSTADVPAVCQEQAPAADVQGGAPTMETDERPVRTRVGNAWLAVGVLVLGLAAAGAYLWDRGEEPTEHRKSAAPAAGAAAAAREPAADAARVEERPPARRLELASVPPGAAVWMNGERIGKTPFVREEASTLAAKVELRLPGHEPWKRRLAAGHRASVITARLIPIRRAGRRVEFARLKVGSLSQGRQLWADVYIDGKKRGQSPLLLDRIPAGSHTVEIRRAGFQGEIRRIRLRPGQRRTLLLHLGR